MKHYFRVYDAPQNFQRKRKNFFLSWLSGLNVTGWLILANVLLFVLALLLASFAGIDRIYNLLALQPNNLLEKGYYWTLLTSMFMHANFFHLFVNMFSLFFIGKFLEMLIGKKRFFWLYIVSGMFAGLFFALFSYFFGASQIGEIGGKIFGNPEIFAVGASGAIFAIAGVLAFLTPRNKVYLIAGPLVALIVQAIANAFVKSALFTNIFGFLIMLYIFISIFAIISFNPAVRKIALPIEMPFWLLPFVAITPLIIIGLFIELPIGNMAHLGGFIAGAAYGLYLRLRYKKKTRIIAEYFSR